MLEYASCSKRRTDYVAFLQSRPRRESTSVYYISHRFYTEPAVYNLSSGLGGVNINMTSGCAESHVLLSRRWRYVVIAVDAVEVWSAADDDDGIK